jgi:peptidoglycan/LPS O-acetylase OafA/YrhL
MTFQPIAASRDYNPSLGSAQVVIERAGSRNGLDAMRLFFAALVLVSHSPELIDGDRSREPLTLLVGTCSFGELAVIGFFVLSGYLITNSWHSRPELIPYLRNRILRIVPGFVVAVLISTLVVGAIGASDAATYYSSINWRQLFGGIVTLGEPRTPPTFAGSPVPAVNGSLWTIRYEFICYLIAPVAIFRRSALLAIWILAAVTTVASPDPLPRFLFAFLSGAVFQQFRLRATTAGVVASMAALPILLSMSATWELGAIVAGGYLALCVGLRPLPYRGPDFSYGLYLYGWPIQMMLIMGGLVQPWLLFFAALPLAAGCGLLSWYIVEKPALRLKRRLRSAPAPIVFRPTDENADRLWGQPGIAVPASEK